MNRRLAIISFFLLALISLGFYLQSQAAGGSIVVGSYRIAGSNSTTDEYVELYNPTKSTINVTGWQLAKKTASGTKYALVTAFPAAQIAPGESLIVGHKDSTELVDIGYSTGYSISEDNTIILYSDAGKTIVDKVGFGKAAEFEGVPAPTAAAELWSRQSGLDTDHNLNDFKKYTGPTKDYSGICISEVLLSPAEGEEWIEIYNSEMAKDIGGLIIADKSGSVKQFAVPAGTIIKEGQYLVFHKKDTGITLNDDGDGVVLIDGTGRVFDDTGDSGKSTKGLSFAFNGTKWQWTAQPTPGGANKINVALSSSSSITSKKRAIVTSNNPTASTKGTVPSAEVLGATDSNAQTDIFANRGKTVSANDRLFGLMLLGVALGGGLVYTVYVKREKIVATFNEERRSYAGAWEKFWSKMPWR